jgi:geranylgeranyl pyrophosphate synthase
VTIEELLARERSVIEAALDRVLPAADEWPQRLHSAMRHAVFGGGKRVRPILARVAHRAAGGDPDLIVDAACGLELIHTYSLVHDDLPAMDDDILRRGRPTVHVAFDEATAILTGDALLTEGLLLIATRPLGPKWAELRARAAGLVGEAISSRGMVGGQVEDMAATGGPPREPEQATLLLERIHHHKTGRLLQASVELGAALAGATQELQQRFASFGRHLGHAFQIADDLLDATATSDELGKSPGKDAATGKLTYVTLYGIEDTRKRLGELEEQLLAAAQSIEGSGGYLADLARFVCRRRH